MDDLPLTASETKRTTPPSQLLSITNSIITGSESTSSGADNSGSNNRGGYHMDQPRPPRPYESGPPTPKGGQC
jgi:hypothetical protein